MIRRLARSLVCLGFVASCAGLLAGCVSVRLSNGVAATILLVPILVDDGEGRMATGGGYYDSRWFSDPDSHPAVRPKPGAPKTPQQPAQP